MKIATLVVGLFIFILITTCIFLQNKKIQTLVAQVAAIELSEYVGSEVSIGGLDYRFFSHILLKDLRINDQHNHEMIYLGNIDAHFDFWRFFRKEFIINRLDIDSAYVFLEYDTAGVANYNYLLPLLASEPKEMNILLQLEDIYLHKSRFRFRDERHSGDPTTHLNPHDIDVSQIEAHLSLEHFTKDSLSAHIKHLSGCEKSGLSIEKISTQVQANHAKATISPITFRMPHSQILTDSIILHYGDIKNIDLTNLFIKSAFNASTINLKDISMVHSSLHKLNGDVGLQLKVDGSLSNLQVNDIAIKYNSHPVLSGHISIKGLPDLHTTKIHANIDELALSPNLLQDFLSDLQGKPYSLPQPVQSLGKIQYKGQISGIFNHIELQGSLQTQLGALSLNLLLNARHKFKSLHFDGKVQTSRFHIGRLLGDPSLGNIAFNLSGDVLQDSLQPLHGTIKGDIGLLVFNQYAYSGIHADGYFNTKGFNGQLSIEDPNLSTTFKGLIDLTQQLPEFKFDLAVTKANLNALNLIEKYTDSDFKCQMNVNMQGNSLDNLNGYILFDSIRFRNKEKIFAINNINVSSTTTPTTTQVLVQSDIIKAHFTGNYKYSTLPITFQRLIAKQLPALFSAQQKKNIQENQAQNEIDFSVQINDTYDLTQTLELPIRLSDVSLIKGYISEKNNSYDLRIGIPKILIGKLHTNNISVQLNNHNGYPHLSAYLQQGKRKSKAITFNADIEARQDSILTSVNWFNKDTIVNKGDINSLVVFDAIDNALTAQVHLLPSSFILRDSLWNLSSGPIEWRKDTTLHIDNFSLSNSTQHIYINGVMGRSLSDSLKLNLKQIDLGYIINMIPTLGDVSFGGEATGEAHLYSVLNQPIFEANVFLKDGNINQAPVGDVYANAVWDKDNQEIDLTGIAVEGKDTIALVDGYIAPIRDSIELFYNAQGLSLGFITRYMSEFADHVSGKGYGKVRMYGTLKTPNDVHFEGSALVKDGKMRVAMLGTHFTFSDSIYLTEKVIKLPQIPVNDAEGNRALLDGEVTHDGTFQDLHYRILITCEDLLAMNTLISDNDFFFGKVYATGNVLITGDEKESQINVNARTRPNTEFNISLASASVATDNSFVTFVSTEQSQDEEEEEDIKEITNSANVKLRLNIEATPDATLQVIIDPKTGDLLTGRGTGNLVVEYDSNSEDVRMMGTYTITSGSYQFTLQNVFRKDFKIAQGSSLTWAGDPLNAQVNIKALYSLTASLRDLMAQSEIEATTKRSSVPVNCLLYLTDQLTSPTIRFDIELPNSDEALKQQVRNIINTDEMMNRQILYLLVFNKFYTPEYLQTSMANIGSNEAYSLLSSTVTGQINNWISKLTDDFSFGFNVRAHGEGETATQEYETEILYQPNNRLIVNGNFGYRNDNLATNKFIGDVDVEYMLSQNGKFRVKAYTHTVDKYSLKTAQTMQGVGLIYKEEFNNPKELLTSFKELFTSKKKKNKNAKKNKIAAKNKIKQANPTQLTNPTDSVSTQQDSLLITPDTIH